MAGFDAIAHAVETCVTTRRTPMSDTFSQQAWRLLERRLRARAADTGRPRSAVRDAAGRAPGRHGDRAIDARRDPRLRQPADRALRHDARAGHRDPAAARRPLERAGRARSLSGARRLAAAPRPRRGRRRNAGPPPRGSRPRGRPRADPVRERRATPPISPTSPRRLPSNGPAPFNPRPFDAAGAMEIYRAAL